MPKTLYISLDPEPGKTTTAILLEKKLRSEGHHVACLQMNKDKRMFIVTCLKGVTIIPFPSRQPRQEERLKNGCRRDMIPIFLS
jgi:hypothetical protein